MDPPWNDHESYDDSLSAILESETLLPSGILVCEHYYKDNFDQFNNYKIQSKHQYGDCALTVLKK